MSSINIFRFALLANFLRGIVSLLGSFVMCAHGEDFAITFNSHHAAAKESADVADEMDLFMDQPVALAWQMLALPGTTMRVRGQVYQAASSLAVPLKELSFEVKIEVAAGAVRAEAGHALGLPQTDRPALYLLKWQADSGGKAAAGGMVRIRRSPRGILVPLKRVSIAAGIDLKPLATVFEQDQVQVTLLDEPEPPTGWDGVFIMQANAAVLGQLKKAALEPEQSMMVVGDMTGMQDTIVAKSAGHGRLLILPARYLSRFSTSPSIQRFVVEFCQPTS